MAHKVHGGTFYLKKKKWCHDVLRLRNHPIANTENGWMTLIIDGDFVGCRMVWSPSTTCHQRAPPEGSQHRRRHRG